jgi:Na+:H+ antiporter, NhaA family
MTNPTPGSTPAVSSDVLASLVLLAATVLALLCANSAVYETYKATLAWPITVGLGEFAIVDTLKSWIKNALMAVFFLLVGLEIKSEFTEGALAERQRALLPFLAAAGGMLVPALVYLAVVRGEPGLARGWAIPSATDIAFAVGVVGLLGSYVSAPLKAFLLAVAVIDDLGAILVIALFYSGGISPLALGASLLIVGVLKGLNVLRVTALWPYLAVGVLLWIAVYHSGVNPTVAGVVVALFVPLKGAAEPGHAGSPLHKLVDRLKNPVSFVIMPIFAFANAGVSLKGMGLEAIAQPVTLGVMLGLLVGKPIGITAAILLAERFGVAMRPMGATLRQLIGIAALAGIGFTMSLFTGQLAFGDGATMDKVRLGVLLGSLFSTVLGVALLVSWNAGKAAQG